MLWGAILLFGVAFVGYVVMLFVPVGAFVDYTSTLTVLPHKFLYASYPTPLASQHVYMDYYTIGEYYTAGTQIPAHYVPIVQLVLLVGLLVVLLSISTYLSRYWFLLSQGIFAAILYSCNIDQLRLFGRVEYKNPYKLQATISKSGTTA